jgi:glycosyltransferase involved in cell wall biosynthesis
MTTRLTARSTPVRPSAPPAERGRVLVVMRWPLGGIRTHVLYNVPQIQGHGYRFTFVGPDDASFDTFAWTFSRLPGAEFIRVPTYGKWCPLWRAVRREVRTGRYNLLHSHGLTAAVQGVAGCFGTGMPHVTTLHDVFRPCHFTGWRGRVKRWVLARALRRLTAIIAVGDDVQANLLEYFPSLERAAPRRVTIINGIDVHKFGAYAPVGNDLRQRLELHSETALLGFLGRFMEQKGFLVLLDAIEQLISTPSAPPFHLVAVGCGDYKREYQKDIQRRGLDGQVSLLDFTPDVLPVLQQLDLLVMPSLWEACPLQPMEAMAAGVPVLGTDCIGLREVLRGTPSRVVRAGDAESLAAGLHEALRAPRTAEAREYAAEACRRFDNERSARRLVELYDEMCVRRQQGTRSRKL